MNFEGGGAFEKQEILRDKYIIIFSLFKKKKKKWNENWDFYLPKK